MTAKQKKALVILGVSLASVTLGWLQTSFGVDLGLCPGHTPSVEFAADAGVP